MIKVLICVLFLIPSQVFANEISTDWSLTDTALQVIFTGLLEADREQTIWIAKHPLVRNQVSENEVINTRYTEKNKIIGNNASSTRIDTYFATCAITNAAISYGLRKSGWNIFGVPLVTLWQATSIHIEGKTVVDNISINIGTTFN